MLAKSRSEYVNDCIPDNSKRSDASCMEEYTRICLPVVELGIAHIIIKNSIAYMKSFFIFNQNHLKSTVVLCEIVILFCENRLICLL